MSVLGEAASVVTVIDISAKIFELCQTYVSAVKEEPGKTSSASETEFNLSEIL